jgi:AraC-like DNA-binding protein
MYLSHTLLANQSVAAIAARWCFVDQAHFTRAFRAQFGMTASSVRRNTMGSTN